MKVSYDVSKKIGCDCKCEECFEDNTKIEENHTLKMASTIVLLLSVLFVVLSVVAIFGG